MNAIDTLISALEGSPEVRPGTARSVFGAALDEIVYPQPDIDRLNLLRDAVGVCGPKIAWKTADVLRCFRDVGVPMTKASARSLLARLTAEGVLTRIDEPGRRHFVVADQQAKAEPEIPRTERSRWQDVADALNRLGDAGMAVGIDLDGTLTDHSEWSVIWDREAKRWTVSGYDDAPEAGDR